MRHLMPTIDEAIVLIEAAGHVLHRDADGLVEYQEWGDTPCSGPQCLECGDIWCLWERYLYVERCGS